MQPSKNIFFVAFIQKKAHLFTDVLFSVIFACGEFYAQVRDMSFGRDMRFARWKLQGEYNITAERSGAISLLQSKNITLSASEAYHENLLPLLTFMLY